MSAHSWVRAGAATPTTRYRAHLTAPCNELPTFNRAIGSMCWWTEANCESRIRFARIWARGHRTYHAASCSAKWKRSTRRNGRRKRTDWAHASVCQLRRGKSSLVLQLRTGLDTERIIDVEHIDGHTANCCAPHEVRAFPPEMSRPLLPSRIEQRYQLAGDPLWPANSSASGGFCHGKPNLQPRNTQTNTETIKIYRILLSISALA